MEMCHICHWYSCFLRQLIYIYWHYSYVRNKSACEIYCSKQRKKNMTGTSMWVTSCKYLHDDRQLLTLTCAKNVISTLSQNARRNLKSMHSQDELTLDRVETFFFLLLLWVSWADVKGWTFKMSILCLNSVSWFTGHILIHCSTVLSMSVYKLHQITSSFTIPEFYSPSQSSTFKWTPCGFIFSVVRRLPFALSLRRSTPQTFLQLFVTAWSKKILGISHTFLYIYIFFLVWPSTPIQ